MNRPIRIILFLEPNRGFARGMLKGIARYSALNGPWTFYRKAPDYLEAKPEHDLGELKSWQPDGIVCSIKQARELRTLGVPIIGYDPVNYKGSIPCVNSDDAETGRLAAKHLLNQGHRKFAFCGFDNRPWSQRRCNAFEQTIQQAGGSLNIYQQVQDAASRAKEEPLLKEWIHSLPKPIGLFCANDDRAASVMEICRVLGFSVPEDLSIIGADDDEYICELQNPPLSSVQIAAEQAGYEAAQLLYQIIQGEASMQGQRIPALAGGISARQSTDMLMVQNEPVRKALCFIRENANKPIQVSDVVHASGLSHRSLNGQFHAALGGSILKQLTRARIDYICQLLTNTELRVHEIASTVGYEDDRHFARYFKRATGLTPQAYRRKISPP
ncbi:MAG: substrate-binding domain-containing protein [Opitutales bacterium]